MIGHGEMGEIVEAVLAQPNVKWETAGVLDGGRAVWCLALLDEPVELPGDDSPTLPYLAITNRHDGTAACALRATAVRIVCANTFRAAELEGERTGATFSFIHKLSWRNRIEEARQAVTGARTEMRRYTELAQRAARHPRHAEAAGAVRHRVHPHATRKAWSPTGWPATSRKPAHALRMIFESKTTEQVAGHRLRPGPGRRRVPRPRPHRPVLGDPAEPDPDPARAAQAPGAVADPRGRRSGMTTRGVPRRPPHPGAPRPATRRRRRTHHGTDQHLLGLPRCGAAFIAPRPSTGCATSASPTCEALALQSPCTPDQPCPPVRRPGLRRLRQAPLITLRPRTGPGPWPSPPEEVTGDGG